MDIINKIERTAHKYPMNGFCLTIAVRISKEGILKNRIVKMLTVLLPCIAIGIPKRVT